MPRSKIPVLHPLALCAMLAVSSLPLRAQQAPQATQTVVVTGNPFGHDIASQPSSVVSGQGLALRRAGTLGETLDGLPGVAASGFGANASRPVIRGLDGDRVRLLDNGGASIDASNLSFDHASATDPLVAERIEVLRGPAALQFGGNATGGVVNSIDNRIPRIKAEGLSGRAELRLGGAAAENSGAAVLEGGRGPWAWHLDAAARGAGELRAPLYTPVDAGEALAPSRRVRNSAARSEGGAFGAGWVGADARLGASVETARQHYGVTAEPDTTIRMQRDRLALAGEMSGLKGPFAQIEAQASHTRYRHEEVEGDGAVGTTFTSRGDELRLQARHAPWGAWHGLVGLQAETLDFRALGEEAFVPPTHTRSTAAYLLEETQRGAWHFGAGLRGESVRVASDGGGERFGSATSRRFAPFSASLQARVGAAQGWQASATLGHTERAPAYYELYADGVHVATAAYERGDPALGVERSRHAELGLAWASRTASAKASVFQTDFARFIALDASGASIATDAGELPEYRFRGVRARLRGFELEGKVALLQAEGGRLELSGTADAVRGDDLDSGQPLPRLAPMRLRGALEWQSGAWRAGAGLRHAARQSRVPATDTATAGWTMLDLWAAGQLPLAESLGWFARLNNATNRLGTNAVSVATVRGLTPMPARALTVGLRAAF